MSSSIAATTQLQRMRAKAQGEEARLINLKGRQLIVRLNLLLRTSSIHAAENEALQRSIEFFIQAVADLLKVVSPLVVQGDQDQLYINDFRVRGDATVYSNTKTLVQELKSRGCGGITIHQEITREEVLKLLNVLRAQKPPGPDDEGFEQLNTALSEAEVHSLIFNRYLELGSGADVRKFLNRNKVTVALKTYAKVLVTMKRVSSLGADLKPIERLKLIKNVQSLIDLCYDDEVFFEGLGSLKFEGEYSYFHPVHVAMLSVQIGKHVGLSKKLLMELGMAALFYDIGRSRQDGNDYEKAGELTTEEWDEVRRHPLRSTMEILKARTLNEGVRKRLVVAFEHHIWFRGGGYPQRIHARQPHLFSRIVGIADAYDALTTSRPYREGYLPAEALRIMMDESGKQYDPILLRILVNILQIYPIGTMVFLDTREIASVYHNQSEPSLQSRPLVRLLTNPAGQPVSPKVMNLAEKNPQGQFIRSIVRTLEPDEARAWLPPEAL